MQSSPTAAELTPKFSNAGFENRNPNVAMGHRNERGYPCIERFNFERSRTLTVKVLHAATQFPLSKATHVQQYPYHIKLASI